MEQDNALSFIAVFKDLPDPRSGNAVRHPFESIFTIAVCAVLCGAQSWVEVEEYGQAYEEWFKTFLDLPHGIPSHDTFGRVFGLIDPDAFEKLFVCWSDDLAQGVQHRRIAIDGKTLRRSMDKATGKAGVHMVSAFLQNHGLVLGQLATDAKSNEITAIPRLLDLLNLKDALVTLDAMGCQRQIAQKIQERGGDYVLVLKANQPELLQAVKDVFAEHPEMPESPKEQPDKAARRQQASQTSKGHGRLEVRRLTASTELRGHTDWPGLEQVLELRRSRTIDGQTTHETVYGITSLTPQQAGAELLLQAVRGHWAVENQLHWCLDVQDREDDCRVRTRNAAQNLSRLRRLTLNLLRRDTTCKASLRIKRRRCVWRRDYMLQILGVGSGVKESQMR